MKIPFPRIRPKGCKHKKPCKCVDRLMDRTLKEGIQNLFKPKVWTSNMGATIRAVR